MASSIRKIAAATGFSTATVSLALRNKGRFPATTRQAVREAAIRLGYQANRQLARDFAIMRRPAKLDYRETLALIAEFPEKEAPDFQREIYRFAGEHARLLGYNLELYTLSTGRANHQRLSRLLRNRGIRGLMFMPRVKHLLTRFFLDWQYFTAVEIGRTVNYPSNLHKIDRPIYYEMIEAIHHLRRSGYRKLGLAIQPNENRFRKEVYVSAYYASFKLTHSKLLEDAYIPPLNDRRFWDYETFRDWLRRWRPEVLLVQQFDEIGPWLERMKLRIPHDISIFMMNVKDSGYSGFKSDFRSMAEACVDMLSLLLEQNQLGLQRQPRVWMVRDTLMVGNSLKKPLTVSPLYSVQTGFAA